MTNFEDNEPDHVIPQESNDVWFECEEDSSNDEFFEAPTVESVNDVCNDTRKGSRFYVAFGYVEELSSAQFLALLGMQWPNFERIRDHVDELRQMLSAASSVELEGMMTRRESALHGALPAEFVAYRGGYLANADGLSWYLDREPAAEFPLLRQNRINDLSPFLLTALVRKEDCVVKVDEGLLTVVAWKAEIQRKEMLPRAGH